MHGLANRKLTLGALLWCMVEMHEADINGDLGCYT